MPVCGPPVSGSIIISALPWSAVVSIAPPLARTAFPIPPRQASICLDRLDGGLDLGRVADHVGIGKVDDDHVKGAVVRGFDNRLSNSRGFISGLRS